MSFIQRFFANVRTSACLPTHRPMLAALVHCLLLIFNGASSALKPDVLSDSTSLNASEKDLQPVTSGDRNDELTGPEMSLVVTSNQDKHSATLGLGNTFIDRLFSASESSESSTHTMSSTIVDSPSQYLLSSQSPSNESPPDVEDEIWSIIQNNSSLEVQNSSYSNGTFEQRASSGNNSEAQETDRTVLDRVQRDSTNDLVSPSDASRSNRTKYKEGLFPSWRRMNRKIRSLDDRSLCSAMRPSHDDCGTRMSSELPEERATCPFCWEVDEDEVRVPRRVLQARCLCDEHACNHLETNSKDRFTCQPVKKRISVAWRTGPTTLLPSEDSMEVRMGCVCVGKLDRSVGNSLDNTIPERPS